MSTRDLHPRLAAAAHQHDGLFLRSEALAAGYASDDIRSLTRAGGPWTVLRRGVYILTEGWQAADDSTRSWLLDLAAHRGMRTDHLMSHDSAARALGIPLIGGRTQLSHVTRRGVQGSRTHYGVKHHLGRELPAAVVTSGGVPLTGDARTALDLAREHGFDAGVVAIDHVLGGGTSLRSFEHELARMTRWPFVRTSRRALAFADPRAESVGESLTRILLAELGWEPLDAQFAIPVDGDGIRWCDLRYRRHLVEFDGRLKYRPVGEGGFATIDPADVAFRDRKRDTDIGQWGLGISPVTWRDLFSGRAQARARLRREEALTCSRFGTELPSDLLEFARRNPRVAIRRAS